MTVKQLKSSMDGWMNGFRGQVNGNFPWKARAVFVSWKEDGRWPRTTIDDVDNGCQKWRHRCTYRSFGGLLAEAANDAVYTGLTMMILFYAQLEGSPNDLRIDLWINNLKCTPYEISQVHCTPVTIPATWALASSNISNSTSNAGSMLMIIMLLMMTWLIIVIES